MINEKVKTYILHNKFSFDIQAINLMMSLQVFFLLDKLKGTQFMDNKSVQLWGDR